MNAFDTVDHKILLSILENDLKITGVALQWFKSFLNGRKQKVKCGCEVSESIDLKYGVPQGTVLGPVLFNIYTRSLPSVFHNCGFQCNGYADDNSGRKVFNLYFREDIFIHKLPQCLSTLKSWMADYFLKLNDSKTDIVIFGKNSVLSKLNLHGIITNNGNCIKFSDSVKNLGVNLDKSLTLDKHINHIVSSSYNCLRKISYIRKFINTKQCEQLIHSIISSKLDFSNSLLLGLPSYALQKLQRVQNAAMRKITRKRKYQSVSNDFNTYHWLNIEQRIIFKTLVIIYKCIHGNGPKHLINLLNIHSRQSNNNIFLQINSFFPKSLIGKRAFQYYAPHVWNNIPSCIRNSITLLNFKSLLKTFLFQNFSTYKQTVNRHIKII